MLIRYSIWLLFIGLQIAIGVIIYYQSGKDLLGFVWLENQFSSLSIWLSNLLAYMPIMYREGWIDNHLPDILWSSACASFLVGIWVNQLTLLKLLPLGVACAIFYEAFQLLGVTDGTYDHFDMLYSLIAGVISTLLTYLLFGKSFKKSLIAGNDK